MSSRKPGVDEPDVPGVLERNRSDVEPAYLITLIVARKRRESVAVPLPVDPFIGPTPTAGVVAVQVLHGDAMAQESTDRTVSAREVQHAKSLRSAAGGRDRRALGAKPGRDHPRHPVVGGPQALVVGARIVEIVDLVEVVLVSKLERVVIDHRWVLGVEGSAETPDDVLPGILISQHCASSQG